MNIKKYISLLLASLGIVSAVLVAVPVSANITPPKPTVVGIVSAVNGTTLTVTDQKTKTAYSVDDSSATVMKNGATSSASNIAVNDTVVVLGTLSGTTVTATKIRDGAMIGRMMKDKLEGKIMKPEVVGKVDSINGTTLTVTSKTGQKNGSATITYTVDALTATVMKNGATSSVSSIAAGDIVVVQGTFTAGSTTNVVAKKILDGMPRGEKGIQGTGQPVVTGKVTTITGSIITITNASNVAYTVDATSAKFVVKGVDSPTILNVVVGDNVVVQGTISGTSVTASSVIDEKPQASANENGNNGQHWGLGGFFGGIGNFFKHMFGF